MRLVFLFCMFLFSLSVVGQGVTIFESDEEETSTTDDSSVDVDYNNAIKFGVFNLLRGEFAFFYERKLSSMMTAEVGLGATFYNTASKFGNSLLGDIFELGFGNLGLSNESLDEFSKINVSVGPSIQGLYKFFPSKSAMNGIYFGVNFRYSRFNDYRNTDEAQEYFDGDGYYYDYYYSSSDVYVTNNSRDLDAYRRYLDGLVMVGVEKTNYNGNVYFEWYLGVGFRNISGRDIEKSSTYSYDSFTGASEEYVTYSLGSTRSGVTPMIAGGLKIGGMW